ncbi:bactericidal permeability-increasing protein-like [Siphateles boraxobius]|uniref:bactericidal permeability-increasing protein-like n=1 Tax=Siphateles boraxobius TaxID=180520 RepID=UPI004063828B
MGTTVISSDSIELSLKDIFIRMGQPKKIPHSPTDFTLPSQNTKMFYIGISAFTINSIIAEFHKSGLLIYRITEDMVPSLILSTRTFGAYIPEISKKYPDQKMELEIQTVKEPDIKFEANNLILEVLSTLTAYVIQSDKKLSSLFVLNLKAIVSAQVYGTELNLALKLTLNKIEASIKETNIKHFEVTKLNSFLDNLKDPVFTLINAYLAKGYPLPGYILPFSLGEIHLVNTQVECITCVNTKGYLLIGTDVHFQENASPQHS